MSSQPRHLVKGMPTALKARLPIIREVELPLAAQIMVASGQLQPGTKMFRIRSNNVGDEI